MSAPTFDRIDHVAIRVADMARSVAWYRERLGFERVDTIWGDMPVILQNGGVELALFPAPADVDWPARDERVVRHIALRVDRSHFEAFRALWAAARVPFRFEDHSACHSLYMLDPDGTEIEVVTWDV